MRDQLPGFYEKILPEILLDKKWKEIDKCQSCIMACGENSVYSSKTKCCTYYPFIPNYMLGCILSKNEKASIKIKNYIELKKYILPIGLCAPESYQYKYTHKVKADFGNNISLLCPFYENGGCQVWAQRNSECISFQCYSSYGERGLRFWQLLGDYLNALEMYMTRNLLIKMGYGTVKIDMCFNLIKIKKFDKSSGSKMVLTEVEMKNYWQGLLTPADFFIKCFDEFDYKAAQSFINKKIDLKKLVDV